MNQPSRTEQNPTVSTDQSGQSGGGSPNYVALVTGATGISSIHLIRQLAKHPDFKHVIGVSRRPLYDVPDEVQHVKLDLLDKQAIKDTLSQTEHAREVTHLYQNAFVFTGDDQKDIEVNHGMHVNIIEGLEALPGARLQHVYANEGGKWYGQAIGPIKTPANEDDPRHLPPNFYYNMEDYMKDRVAHGAKWTWSALRPNPVAGYSEGSAMNIANSIAVYAVICKELGIAMRFPGTEFSWNAVNDVCDADLLADATIYISTHPQCSNQGYNINNGDLFRWKWLWPKLACHFGLECGPIMPMSLDKQMADKEELWSQIVEKHNLKKKSLKEIATWTFADFVFKQPSDWFENTTKLKKTGYTGMCLDTEEMYCKIFKQMEDARVIPKYSGDAKPTGNKVQELRGRETEIL